MLVTVIVIFHREQQIDTQILELLLAAPDMPANAGQLWQAVERQDEMVHLCMHLQLIGQLLEEVLVVLGAVLEASW